MAVDLKHEDRQGKRYAWAKEEIQLHFFSANPVSAILEVTVKNDLRENIQINQQLSSYKNLLRQRILSYFSHRIGVGIIIGQVPVNIQFRTYPDDQYQPKLWITQSGHNDHVKYQYINTIVDFCNTNFQNWSQNNVNNQTFNWSHVQNASLNFMITRPLDYVNREARVVVNTDEQQIRSSSVSDLEDMDVETTNINSPPSLIPMVPSKPKVDK